MAVLSFAIFTANATAPSKAKAKLVLSKFSSYLMILVERMSRFLLTLFENLLLHEQFIIESHLEKYYCLLLLLVAFLKNCLSVTVD